MSQDKRKITEQQEGAKKMAKPALSETDIEAILNRADDVLEELADVDAKIEMEVLEVHKRFWDEKKALFTKRNEILKTIPNFWATALSNHPTLGQLLTYMDSDILKYCTSIESDESDPKRGFTLILHFRPNKYFSNSNLSVEVIMPQEIVDDDEDETDANEPTLAPSAIVWKDAKYSKDEMSTFVNVFENKEMPFICQMIHELVSDPVVAFRGEMEEGDMFDDDEDDEDDE
jgi:template-activating factor I